MAIPANRIITALIITAVVLSCILLGGWFLLTLVLAFVWFGTKEYVTILKNKGFFPFQKVILTVSFLMILLTVKGMNNLLPLAMVIGTIGSFLDVLFRGRQPYIANVATTILGIFLTWMPCYICLIRDLGPEVSLFGIPFKQGLYFLVFIFFVIFCTDVFAYIFGIKYGKHKLCPVISPKKSVEGAVAGGLSAIIIGLIIGKLIGISLFHSFMLSLITTVMAQLGDLSESLIKRDAGVKDSGDSLPGHGGLLDRADSYLFTMPVAYLYIKIFILSGGIITYVIDILEKALGIVAK